MIHKAENIYAFPWVSKCGLQDSENELVVRYWEMTNCEKCLTKKPKDMRRYLADLLEVKK